MDNPGIHSVLSSAAPLLDPKARPKHSNAFTSHCHNIQSVTMTANSRLIHSHYFTSVRYQSQLISNDNISNIDHQGTKYFKCKKKHGLIKKKEYFSKADGGGGGGGDDGGGKADKKGKKGKKGILYNVESIIAYHSIIKHKSHP